MSELIDCFWCGGVGGFEETGSEHHPECDGNCQYCPVPVPIWEECEGCLGTGKIEKKELKRQILHHFGDNLQAIAKLEELGILEA